jgi:hypothetical protein
MAGVEVDVIMAAADSLYGKGTGRTLVIEAMTRPVESTSERYLSQRISDAPAGVTDNYVRRNAVQCDLRVLFQNARADSRAVFVRRDSLALLQRGTFDDFWRGFYNQYPQSGGIVRVSRPGMDQTGTHAMVSVGRSCGRLCGDWGYVLLRSVNGRWQVERHIHVGAS